MKSLVNTSMFFAIHKNREKSGRFLRSLQTRRLEMAIHSYGGFVDESLESIVGSSLFIHQNHECSSAEDLSKGLLAESRGHPGDHHNEPTVLRPKQPARPSRLPGASPREEKKSQVRRSTWQRTKGFLMIFLGSGNGSERSGGIVRHINHC